jgi:hypothetical protein
MVSGNPEDDLDTCRRLVTGGTSRVHEFEEAGRASQRYERVPDRGSQHFTILSLSSLRLTVDQGTKEAHCLPHYLIVDGGKRRLTIAALRYYDTLAKMDGGWRYAERLLYVDRIEERVPS